MVECSVVDEVIAKTAAALRRDHGIKTCDALHIATALRYGVPVLYTYDGLAEDGTTIKGHPFLLSYDGVFGGEEKLKIKVPKDPRPEPPPTERQTQMFGPEKE